MRCNNCGNEINETAKYCPFCGAALANPDYAGAAADSGAANIYEEMVKDSFNSGPEAPAGSTGYNPSDSVNPSYERGPESSYPQPAASEPGKGMGIAGMVLGICTLVFCWVVFISFFTGIVGIVLSAISGKQKRNGFATAGLVTSIIGLAFLLIMLIIGVLTVSNIYYWVL